MQDPVILISLNTLHGLPSYLTRKMCRDENVLLVEETLKVIIQCTAWGAHVWWYRNRHFTTVRLLRAEGLGL